jgi:oxalate decarboxylase/phosphoglucose isomerase-like protein (cupin superfamily)
VVSLGGRESPVSAGATVYIPRNVSISARNTGSEPLGLAFIFSKPGFEELMRENSVLEGQPVIPISAEERDRIRERHKWHTVYPP